MIRVRLLEGCHINDQWQPANATLVLGDHEGRGLIERGKAKEIRLWKWPDPIPNRYLCVAQGWPDSFEHPKDFTFGPWKNGEVVQWEREEKAPPNLIALPPDMATPIPDNLPGFWAEWFGFSDGPFGDESKVKALSDGQCTKAEAEKRLVLGIQIMKAQHGPSLCFYYEGESENLLRYGLYIVDWLQRKKDLWALGANAFKAWAEREVIAEKVHSIRNATGADPGRVIPDSTLLAFHQDYVAVAGPKGTFQEYLINAGAFGQHKNDNGSPWTTLKDKDLIRLAHEGKKNPEIARALGISEPQVRIRRSEFRRGGKINEKPGTPGRPKKIET